MHKLIVQLGISTALSVSLGILKLAAPQTLTESYTHYPQQNRLKPWQVESRCILMSPVRVLLRHSVVVASPKRIVINHTQLFAIRFGTSVPKSKAEVIFHYSFWNFRSQIEEKADLPQFVLEEIEKPRTFGFGTCPPNRREDAKAEIVFTIRYETWSWSRKDQRHFFINHFPIRIETRNKTSAFKLDTGCHEGLRFANFKLDRF